MSTSVFINQNMKSPNTYPIWRSKKACEQRVVRKLKVQSLFVDTELDRSSTDSICSELVSSYRSLSSAASPSSSRLSSLSGLYFWIFNRRSCPKRPNMQVLSFFLGCALDCRFFAVYGRVSHYHRKNFVD